MSHQLEGRQAVREALRAGRPVDKLYVHITPSVGELVEMARRQGVVVVSCDRKRLDAMSKTGAHQGIIACVAAAQYATLEDIFTKAGDQAPLIVVCDGVEDPRNLGAVIRSAEAAGAHGVMIPKRGGAGLTEVTAKAAAGALEHIAVVRVSGIPMALRQLKERGVWVYGAQAEGGQSVFATDFSGGPTAIVVGSEGKGLSRLTAQLCDVLVSIPMRGQVSSLNVAAAAAVILFQASEGREGKS